MLSRKWEMSRDIFEDNQMYNVLFTWKGSDCTTGYCCELVLMYALAQKIALVQAEGVWAGDIYLASRNQHRWKREPLSVREDYLNKKVLRNSCWMSWTQNAIKMGKKIENLSVLLLLVLNIRCPVSNNKKLQMTPQINIYLCYILSTISFVYYSIKSYFIKKRVPYCAWIF